MSSQPNHPIVKAFIHHLQILEKTKSSDGLIQLFSETAKLQNKVTHRAEYSRQGATDFWQSYLSAFQKIESQFYRILQSQTHAVLEWVSTGETQFGSPIEYEGVSVLEFDEEKITRFTTYYDSNAFLHQSHMAHALGHVQPEQRPPA